MADIETTWAVIRRAEEINEALNQITKPTNEGKPLFSAIQAEADHKRRFENAMIALAENTTPTAPPAPLEPTKQPAQQPKHVKTPNPWEIEDSRDTTPEYTWWTAARFFARQLVAQDSTLLRKPNLLRGQIAKAMFKVGVKNRSRKEFKPETIKKALINFDYAQNNRESR